MRRSRRAADEPVSSTKTYLLVSLVTGMANHSMSSVSGFQPSIHSRVSSALRLCCPPVLRLLIVCVEGYPGDDQGRPQRMTLHARAHTRAWGVLGATSPVVPRAYEAGQ